MLWGCLSCDWGSIKIEGNHRYLQIASTKNSKGTASEEEDEFGIGPARVGSLNPIKNLWNALKRAWSNFARKSGKKCQIKMC